MNSTKKRAHVPSLAIIVSLIIGLAGGVLISNYTIMGKDISPASTQEPADEKEILYWVAPMDPAYRRNEAGKSPMGMDLVPVYAPTASTEDDAQVDGAIHINSAVEQNLGVRTATVERRSLWRKIDATGYIGFDESRLSQINVRTEGWIQRLLVETEGERVRKGQLLFEFYSPQLVYAQKEYTQAKRRNDNRLLIATEKKLLALGMEAPDIKRLSQSGKVSETVQVLAPQDGIITQLNVQEGIFIKPDTAVMSLADLSSVWLQAGVFESQSEWVAAGQPVEARLNYMPGKAFNGRVDYVYPVLDPVTRTLQVRMRFDNPDELMKPNMYARVTIFGKSHPGALSIPREALIRGNEFDRVVVSLGNGGYSVREVISGIESGEWVEIISGLDAGDEVVTSAQFLLDSEASMSGSIHRLTASDQNTGQTYMTSVFGSGRVEAIDSKARRIRVSHGPIEALGWAAMTMEFDVLPAVDLQKLRIGQNIRFSLSTSEVGDYQINIIQTGEHDPHPQPSNSGGDT